MGIIHENLPKRCRGETENERESGCRNRKGRRNNIYAANADSDQQDGNKEAQRRAQGVGRFQKGSRGICVL